MPPAVSMNNELSGFTSGLQMSIELALPLACLNPSESNGCFFSLKTPIAFLIVSTFGEEE
jgi:hypothetical protein